MEQQDFDVIAYETILHLAQEKCEFTADDVAIALGDAKGDIRMWFVRAENLGIIERTDTFIRSRRKKQHGRHLRMWRSRLLDSPAPERKTDAPFLTECCRRPLRVDERYCPRCGWEARVVEK